MATKKKLVTSAAAVATAAVMVLGGTFAWQSISQTSLGEGSDIVNPGGRLHDDFDGTNKDVYVENFAEDEIFARVQLNEYFEVILNEGTAGERELTLAGSKMQQVVDGTPVTNEEGEPVYDYTYATHYFGLSDEDKEAGTASEEGGEVDNLAYTWWDWTTDGEKVFMPTFNKNKDSLQADVNGVYVDAVGGISNRDGNQYTGYEEYELYDLLTRMAIYDADSNMIDELADAGVDIAKVIDGTDTTEYAGVKLLSEEHEAKYTQYGSLLSMEEWLTQVEVDGGYDAANHGNNWVYDEDGWVYWSAPIPAGEATGLLLNEIGLTDTMEDTWYYAIEVVGQFVTAGDMGSEADGTGFYDLNKGSAPSDNALRLLDYIGVNDISASGDGTTDEDAPYYPMYLYTHKPGTILADATYLIPGEEYEMDLRADLNDYGDTTATFSLTGTDENYIPIELTAGVDYVLTQPESGFEIIVNEIGEEEYQLIGGIQILNEDLVGGYVTVHYTCDVSGNSGSYTYQVHFREASLELQLFDSEGVEVTGNTLAPNSVYDIVASMTDINGDEHVLYSTLPDRYAVSDRVTLLNTDSYTMIWTQTWISEENYIDENGRLQTGDAATFDYIKDGVNDDEGLIICMEIKNMSVYAEGAAEGDEPIDRCYGWGQLNFFAQGYEPFNMHSSADQGDGADVSAASPEIPFMVQDYNSVLLTDDDITVTISGKTDATTTATYVADQMTWVVNLGPNETATTLTVTASNEDGSGTLEIPVNYIPSVELQRYDADADEYLVMTSNELTTDGSGEEILVRLRTYSGETIEEGVTWSLYNNTDQNTVLEDGILYLAGNETGNPLTVQAFAAQEDSTYYADLYITLQKPALQISLDADKVYYTGETYQILTADDTECDWSVSGGNGTSSISGDENGGNLTIGWDEADGTELTLIAADSYDNARTATAVITVKKLTALTLVVDGYGEYQNGDEIDMTALAASGGQVSVYVKESGSISWALEGNVENSGTQFDIQSNTLHIAAGETGTDGYIELTATRIDHEDIFTTVKIKVADVAQS